VPNQDSGTGVCYMGWRCSWCSWGLQRSGDVLAARPVPATLHSLEGVANLPVRAWRLDGAEFQEVRSGGGRSYTMHVISGTWELRATSPADLGYVTAQPPQRSSGATGWTF
jgi:hypothetical protein